MIAICINGEQVDAAAKDLAAKLTPSQMNDLFFHGEITQEKVATALHSGWLHTYLQGVVDLAMENLGRTIINEGSVAETFFQLVPGVVYVDSLEDGCYCGECFQACTPDWAVGYDCFVPRCHPNAELIKNPSRGGVEPEIETILALADDEDAAAYHQSQRDMRDTETEHS